MLKGGHRNSWFWRFFDFCCFVKCQRAVETPVAFQGNEARALLCCRRTLGVDPAAERCLGFYAWPDAVGMLEQNVQPAKVVESPWVARLSVFKRVFKRPPLPMCQKLRYLF